MEFSDLEAAAQRKAAQHVANMLQTPDKLEKVHQMKRNAGRKKASVEALLKTAMQSQLDGVRTGLSQLQTSLIDLKDIKEAVNDLDDNLASLPALLEALNEVRAETIRHSQLATATDNLKHLFTVPESVRNTESLIEEGQLLEAHQSLAELENSRDDLLLELHKFGHKDKDILDDYFSPVQDLSVKLEKQIKFILRRTLNSVRKDPKLIVTALRIVEREEKMDAEALHQQKSTNFLAPGRPKEWKKKALDILTVNVQERIEGNQLDERDTNKMWLVRHLELIRQITLEDLRIAKTLCQPVFPPHYEIFEHFIKLYNEALANRLNEIITMGLQDQEYVTMLEWLIQTYPGPDLMGHERLQIPADKIPQLLNAQVVADLEQQYLVNMKENYRMWMSNAMKLEVEDWYRDKDPDPDAEGAFQTSAPKMIYRMIEENLQVTATISQPLTSKVLQLSMSEVANFGDMYRMGVLDYKKTYFTDRAKISMFTRYVIAIVNNCTIFGELALELKTRWGGKGSSLSADMDKVHEIFASLKYLSCDVLLDEAFLDIDKYFSEILSASWSANTYSVDKICATLEDYFDDYNYLLERNFEEVVTKARDRVARKYITSVFTPSTNILKMRKTVFETNEDRKRAANKVTAESAQLKRFFREASKGDDAVEFDSPFNALSGLAEVLAADSEMLILDVGSFVKQYPDISHQQLFCLLSVRGDLNKSEVKTMATDFAPEDKQIKTQSIFSQVAVSSGTSNPFADVASAVAEKTKEANLNPFGKDF